MKRTLVVVMCLLAGACAQQTKVQSRIYVCEARMADVTAVVHMNGKALMVPIRDNVGYVLDFKTKSFRQVTVTASVALMQALADADLKGMWIAVTEKVFVDGFGKEESSQFELQQVQVKQEDGVQLK